MRHGIYTIRNKCFLTRCPEWHSAPVVRTEWAVECCARRSHVAMRQARGLKNLEIMSGEPRGEWYETGFTAAAVCPPLLWIGQFFFFPYSPLSFQIPPGLVIPLSVSPSVPLSPTLSPPPQRGALMSCSKVSTTAGTETRWGVNLKEGINNTLARSSLPRWILFMLRVFFWNKRMRALKY